MLCPTGTTELILHHINYTPTILYGGIAFVMEYLACWAVHVLLGCVGGAPTRDHVKVARST
jgi:hypothetical protein